MNATPGIDPHRIDPHRSELLLMDFQVSVVALLPDGDALVERAASARNRVSRAGGHTIYIRVGLTQEQRTPSLRATRRSPRSPGRIVSLPTTRASRSIRDSSLRRPTSW